MYRCIKILCVVLTLTVLISVCAVGNVYAVDRHITAVTVSAEQIETDGFYNAVQSALNLARDSADENYSYQIFIPEGTYTVNHTLKIYSHTQLYLGNSVILRDKNAKINIIRTGTVDTCDSGVTGYDAYVDIKVSGGILNGNYTSNTIIKVAHATNFCMENVTLKNVRDGHMMEVAGVDGLQVTNCRFINQTMSGSIGYEAIQLDVLSQFHFPTYRSENLPIKNVRIEKCSFEQCPRGIGSHTAIDKIPLDGIAIKNNTFTDMTSVAIQGLDWQNCEITGNIIDNTPRGIALYSVLDSGRGTYNSSYFANEGRTAVRNEPVRSRCRNIKVSGNIIRRCGYVNDTHASYESLGILVRGGNVQDSPAQSDGSGNIRVGTYYCENVSVNDNQIEVKGHGIVFSRTIAQNTCLQNNQIRCSVNTINSANYHGIHLYNYAGVSSVISNQVTGASVNGIYLYKSSNVIDMGNNTVIGSGKYGISIDNANLSFLYNNVVRNSAVNGIQVSNAGKVSNYISGNTVVDSGSNGINVTANSSVGSIYNNSLKNNGLKNISVSNSSKASIGANYTVIYPQSVALDKNAVTLGVGETFTPKATFTPYDADTTLTWYSSDQGVATVKNGKITAVKVGKSVITARTANGKTATCTVTVKSAPSVLNLNAKSLTLGIGETFDINSSCNSGAYSRIVSYNSADTTKVTVHNTNGLVTAKAVGTTRVIARTYNGKTAVCTITVKKAPTTISLNKDNIMLGMGENFALKVKFNNGETAKSVTYTTNSTKAVTVDKNGFITTKESGVAIITAKTYNGKTAVCKVTVKNAPTSITLNKSSLVLKAGETFDLNVRFNVGEVSRINTYTSVNTNVATVDSKGIVTAKKTGTTSITARTYNGKQSICTVQVK